MSILMRGLILQNKYYCLAPTLSRHGNVPKVFQSTVTNNNNNNNNELYIERSSSQDGIVNLVLNRFTGRNSFSKKFLADFQSAISELNNDKSIRCLIVRSTVPQVFCAGADLKERASMPEDQVEGFVASLRDTFTSLESLPFPTIAAIEGAALGGGLELAMACDLRVAGDKAILGLPETSLGIIPGAGGTQRLPRIVGIAKAKELVYLSKRISAESASSIGLITECVPAGSAADRAQALAVTISEGGPIAQRMAKKAIDGGMQLDIASALKFERSCYANVVKTKDRVEGLAAFVEKRKPKYTGQ